MAEFTCISADSHIVEPGNLWLDYIAPAYRDRAPRVVREDDRDIYMCEGMRLISMQGAASAGRPSEALGFKGRERDVPQGAWDPKARLAEIEPDGVQAEVLYPTMTLRLFAVEDTGLQDACFQAYNDWLTDFCKEVPGRFKGIGVINLDDVPGAIAEMERCLKIGLPGVSIALYQDQERHYGHPDFDPFWAAAEETGAPVSLHILTERRRASSIYRSPADGVCEADTIQRSLAHMTFNGVFERFPKLRVVSAENDIGWMPYYLERMDYVFDRRRNLYQMNLSRETPPSEMVKRNVFLTFMRDKAGVMNRGLIGVDRIMWSSDYPHGDSTWPRSQEMIDYLMDDVPAAEQARILVDNARDLYGF